MQIMTIVGARPQFIKAAMVSREIARRAGGAEEAGATPPLVEILVHTGQHDDANMSDVFFEELSIPRPDLHLGISGGGHGAMTGRMLAALEPAMIERAPDWVLVYGDTNSTLAGALTAAKLGVPIAHVEAGLRSFDLGMPEEINRRLTDHCAALLFAPTRGAVENLRREGIAPDRVVLAGDVMYDAMLFHREEARARSRILDDLGLEPGGFILATVHRAANTDAEPALRGVMDGLALLADLAPVVLPLHPRTRKGLAAAGLLDSVAGRLGLIDPVGYHDMVMLEASAALVATDSGGVQKEAFFNGVPCLTLREETEWTELVEAGANTLVGSDPQRILAGGRAAIGRAVETGDFYGDGSAAVAIVDELLRWGARRDGACGHAGTRTIRRATL